MRLIFMGTPDFAVETLKALIAAGHAVVCVYSQPPRPAGRGLALKASPVQAYAETQGIEVRHPLSLKSPEEQQRFAALNADAAVVVAYGLLLPRAILEAPKLGCFNVHASLLPRWRGAAPLQRAIMAGDAETGVTIMRMEEGLDTGPMVKVVRVAIGPETTTATLHDHLAVVGAAAMVEVLENPSVHGTIQPDVGVTYAKKIDKVEARIDFSKSAFEVRNHIHGLSPFPGAWCMMNGARVKILAARLGADAPSFQCADGPIHFEKLQREGKGVMDAATFLRGFPQPGARLMPRYKLTIEYDGTGFLGWQAQTASTTVQGVLEKALSLIHNQPIIVHGAGRTDTGVHALGQVAHVDLPRPWDPFVLCNAINGNVRPHLVSVLDAVEVSEEFHARFSAVKRRYLFRILNRRAPAVIDKNKVWQVPAPLDAEAMHEGAQHLLGNHDFTTFRASDCQAKSPIKTLDRFDVMRFDDVIEIQAEARSFLHHQVRSMVGSLKHVGEGKWQPFNMRRALEAKNRAACGVVSPPQGLYLISVIY